MTHHKKLLSALLSLLLASVPLSALAQQASKKTTVPFPPIPEGYYTFGVSCAKAIAQGSGDNPPDYLVLFTKKSLRYGMDGGPVISKFEDQGNGRYKVHARSYGNGEDDKGTADNFTVTVLDPNSFLMDGSVHSAVQYTHCPNVPKSIREDWFEF